MRVVSETEQRSTVTASGSMFALAGPSQGSTEVSTWRVALEEAVSGPVHIIDREQVWMPFAGTLEVEVDGRTEHVKAGQALILSAGSVRQITAIGGRAEALVAMTVGGSAMMPGSEDKIPLPWAA
ncbi:cupin (plasmid) [Streptomyces sp. Q6]|uniref:Cupin n=1 Tax=Streptomyces citrinus TaxID=3118173 RepID=A0ACD5AQF4_9ACTN